MSSESKLGMLLGLICLVVFAVVQASPQSMNFKNSPTPPGNQGSPRLEVPIADV